MDPGLFSVWTIATWAVSGFLWPNVWLYRHQHLTRNPVIFLAALLLAVPWIPVLLIAGIFVLVVLGFWFGEIVVKIRRQ